MVIRAHNKIEKVEANYSPLSPISFLSKAAKIFPEKTSIIYETKKFSWKETFSRCKKLASSLSNEFSHGDVIGFFAANTPELYEAHFGVPMAGMVLNALNIRLDPATIGYIIDHSEIKVIFVDDEFLDLVIKAIDISSKKPQLVRIKDPFDVSCHNDFDGIDYEEFISKGEEKFEPFKLLNEWDSISINYTSGTTGKPKGVVYHHRGAYLNALGNALEWEMNMHPVYLWTLPMFHCNGWCFPWTIALRVGTNVCLRKVTAKNIYEKISAHNIDHLCGAPTVLSFIANASEAEKKQLENNVKIMTAAAPPPAKVLEDMSRLGFEITHVYGLTEVYGPAVICKWKDEWNNLKDSEKADLKSRQGVPYIVQDDMKLVNTETGDEVKKNQSDLGEVLLKGNITMKGYLKDPVSTEKAFQGGWFKTGDLGVMYEDGYLQLKDRSKDIIISGGENISSIEIENCIHKIDGVLACAVVAKPDEKWGEVPCAFVEFSDEAQITEEIILNFCKENLAKFKIPKAIIFEKLPKTSTGKIQKVELRKRFSEK